MENEQIIKEEKPNKKMPFWKKIIWGVVVILVILVAVQVINAAKYKMVVNVVEGENVMGINPLTEKLDFGDLSRNNGMTRYVTMKNNGKAQIFVMVLKIGEISDLVKIDKNYFVLKPDEEVKLAFEIKIPPSAEIKKYAGWTIIFRLPKIF